MIVRRPMGDVATSSTRSLRETINAEPYTTVAALALTYHGFARTGSVFWALVWGMLGRTFPIEAVPIALAQGFAQPKKTCP